MPDHGYKGRPPRRRAAWLEWAAILVGMVIDKVNERRVRKAEERVAREVHPNACAWYRYSHVDSQGRAVCRCSFLATQHAPSALRLQ